MNKCLECSKEVEGRSDKNFCSNICKSKYHYNNNKSKEGNVFREIDQQLKKNRSILKKYFINGDRILLKDELIALGFVPKYFTHYWKNESGEVYLFCFEFGFLSKTENGVAKYTLMKWKEGMG